MSARLILKTTTLPDRIIERLRAGASVNALPVHFRSPNPPEPATRPYSKPPPPVPGFESVSRSIPMIDDSIMGATVVTRKVISPAALLDVTTRAMSGAPPVASPVGSLFVVSAMPAPTATRHAAAAMIPTTRIRNFRPARIARPLSSVDGGVVPRPQNNSCPGRRNRSLQSVGRQPSGPRMRALPDLFSLRDSDAPERSRKDVLLQRHLAVGCFLPGDGERSLERERESGAG